MPLYLLLYAFVDGSVNSRERETLWINLSNFLRTSSAAGLQYFLWRSWTNVQTSPAGESPWGRGVGREGGWFDISIYCTRKLGADQALAVKLVWDQAAERDCIGMCFFFGENHPCLASPGDHHAHTSHWHGSPQGTCWELQKQAGYIRLPEWRVHKFGESPSPSPRRMSVAAIRPKLNSVDCVGGCVETLGWPG